MLKTRSSNFELLRIIAILLIISGHLSSEGGVLEATTGFNHDFVLAVASGARIAVNLFLMLGCWFMVDSKFSTKRIIKLYSAVWIYSAFITVILIAAKQNTQISLVETIESFFFFFFRTIWYATIYIMLIIIAPAINKLFEIEERKLRILIIVLFIFISGFSTIAGFQDTYLCALSWFVFIYIFIGYYKLYLKDKWGGLRNTILLLLGVIMYCGAVILRIVVYHHNSGMLALVGKVIDTWVVDYKSVPSFLCSLLIFIFFARINIKRSKVINTLAAGTFGAYIIHQVPAFRHVLWYDIYNTMAWSNSKLLPFLYLGTVLSFFILAALIDLLRRNFVEKWWMNTKMVDSISQKGDSYWLQ